MTFGEVGCFLSHHTIWQKVGGALRHYYGFIDHTFFLQVVREGLEQILILEDDVVFEPYFRYNLEKVLEEAKQFIPNWDLM